LYNSTVEQLLTWLGNFDTVKSMLGAHGNSMEGYLSEVRSMVSRLGKLTPTGSRNPGANPKADEIADVLKNGDMYRMELANMLTEAASGIEAVATEVKEVRRRIDPKLIGKV